MLPAMSLCHCYHPSIALAHGSPKWLQCPLGATQIFQSVMTLQPLDVPSSLYASVNFIYPPHSWDQHGQQLLCSHLNLVMCGLTITFASWMLNFPLVHQ